jgi:hypothetical protein
MLSFVLAAVLFVPFGSPAAPEASLAEMPTILGSWHPELYTLKDGTEQPVTGLIFFSESDWTVLFFEIGADGTPRRGSGEGGTYSLSDDRLVFTHLYYLSGGSTPLEMSVKKPGEGETEPCRVDLGGDRMTIHFPSGNRMLFRRGAGGTSQRDEPEGAER